MAAPRMGPRKIRVGSEPGKRYAFLTKHCIARALTTAIPKSSEMDVSKAQGGAKAKASKPKRAGVILS